jgi:hypothetical protein
VLADLITDRRGDHTDQHVAQILGVYSSTVSRWRRGAGWPEPENYPVLSHWLGLTIEELADMVAIERDEAGVKQLDVRREVRAEMAALLQPIDTRLKTLLNELADLRKDVDGLKSGPWHVGDRDRRSPRRAGAAKP